MIRIETYFCETIPTLEDIKFAFELVESGIAVEIKYFVRHRGWYSRLITPNIVKDNTPEDYFDNVIPHIYGV